MGAKNASLIGGKSVIIAKGKRNISDHLAVEKSLDLTPYYLFLCHILIGSLILFCLKPFSMLITY